LTAVIESTLLELSASHEVWTASVANDSRRSDSLELARTQNHVDRTHRTL
jgi:hypothetical protein